MTIAPPSTGTGLDATAVVAQLRATFASGRTRPLPWRRRQLEGLRRLLVEGEQELLAALAADLGKPAVEGWLSDLAISIDEIDVSLRHLDDWAQPERVKLPLAQKPGRAWIQREPLGVVLVIAPWNYPVQLLLLPVAAALAAGNAVVAKPSELAPATSAAIARLVPRYLDPDAVRVVEGGVEETTALLEQRFDHIFYTGNGTVGRIVMATAAKHLTPVTLELGGKSPTVVDRSADVEVAARRIAWGKYLNAGQTCVAPDHVFVHEAVHDRFLDALHSSITAFYGDDPHTSADYARIVNDRHFARLAGLLDAGGFDAVAIGGTKDASDRYLAPTVVTGVHDDAAVMGEEIFGPILPIIKVPTVEAAIERINAGDKPLALYAFGSQGAAERIVDATSSGGACINHTVFHLAVPGLPFGGVGESGMGSYHGRWGFDTFSHRKSVLEKPTGLDPSIAYPPYGKVKKAILRRLFG